MSRTVIVTRHAGAVEHLRQLGIEGEVVETLTAEAVATLSPRDRVYGPLPVRIIADLTARGVPYYAIDMVLDVAQRGRELRSEEMEASDAKPQRYAVYPIITLPAMPDPAHRSASPKRRLGWVPGGLRTLGLALTAAIALQAGRSIVDASWDAVKAFVADPVGAVRRIGAFFVSPPDWRTLRPALFEVVIACGFLMGSVFVARWLAGRVMHASFRPVSVEPRRVLIQGLSPLFEGDDVEPLRTIDLRLSGLGQAALEATRQHLEAGPRDPTVARVLEQMARLPKNLRWQQNLRAILTHAPSLERVLVIPPVGGGAAQASAFQSLASEILRRSGYGDVVVEIVGAPIDYEDHDQVLGAIVGAMQTARRDGLSDRDIAIDGTAGLKVFSIAAAVATINSRALLIYVNLKGQTLAYDGHMSFVDA